MNITNKRIFFIFIIAILLIPSYAYAGRGCCSSHGGVCGCTAGGMSACCDGSVSKAASCACSPPVIYGCTDYKAENYNANANTNDGSCKYTVYGCTDQKAKNYNSSANKDDGSCKYDILGCMDSKAKNYNKDANVDDNSCEYETGCTDSKAINYNSKAIKDDGSCEYRSMTNDESDNEVDNDDNIEEKVEDNDIEDTIIESNKATNKMKTYKTDGFESIRSGLLGLTVIGIATASIASVVSKNKKTVPVNVNNNIDKRYCPKCGKEINNNSAFCYNCGHSLKGKEKITIY